MMFSLSFSPLACALLIPFAVAQQPAAGEHVGAQGPPISATYDLDSGLVTVVPGAPAVTQPCFANTVDDDLANDALLFPAGDELFDWGVKSCGGSGFVQRIDVGYGSRAVPTSAGGPGGALILRLYAGANGYGVFGQQVAEIELSGLPSSPGLAVSPVRLTVDLGSRAFFLPDGPLGWSYQNPDGLTAPLLVDVVPALGTENALDLYSPGPAPTGVYAGTFTLGPGGASNDPQENSLFLALFEDDTPATLAPLPAAGNPANLSSPAPPVVGSSWIAVFDLRATPGVLATVLVLADRDVPGVATPFGTLVLDLTRTLGPASVRANAQHTFAIPVDATLVGLRFVAQGGLLEPGRRLRLTNGLDATVGTL